MEDTRICYVVAYWGDVKDVCYTSSDYPTDSCNNLFHAMEEYLTCGYVVEILDVVWMGKHAYGIANSLCDRWREVLRQQGYNMEGAN